MVVRILKAGAWNEHLIGLDFEVICCEGDCFVLRREDMDVFDEDGAYILEDEFIVQMDRCRVEVY